MKLQAVEAILGLAGIATATGDTTRALRLAAAGAAHLSSLASDGADVDYQEVIQRVKAATTWEQASAKGRAMTLDEVTDHALSSA